MDLDALKAPWRDSVEGTIGMSELLLSASENQSRLCQNLRDLPLGRAAWNQVLRQSETRSVFLTWQWLSTWWECFGADAELYTVAVLRDQRLIGIAPLLRRHEDGERIIEFLGSGLSDYSDVLASEEDKPEVLATVFGALLRRSDRWDRVRLSNIPETSTTPRLVERVAFPEGFDVDVSDQAVCPALSIERSRQFAERCTRKKSLVRHTRYFERLSPLEFRYLLDADEIQDHLPAFFEQHRDRRFMAGDRSLFDESRNRRFIERVTMPLLESNLLRFAILRWRDETLAYHFGFTYDRVHTWYLPTFNVDYARYSPGEVLLRRLLQDTLESGLREFDFTVGDALHKERFANVKRSVVRVELVSRRSATASRSATRPARRAPETPTLWQRLWKRGATASKPNPSDPEAGVGPVAPRLGVRRRHLWRTPAFDPRPSEFRVGWARYSHIKALARQEGLRSPALIAALARMRRGQKAVIAFWQERPIAVVWLARDARAALARRGFELELPERAALMVDAHLSSDVEGSPRREALMPALQTFLAAEGLSALYGVQDVEAPPSFPERCGVAPVRVAQRTDVGLVFRTWSFQRKLRDFDTAATWLSSG